MSRPVVSAVGSAVAATALYALVLRRRQLHWGSTSEEVASSLPGDELLAQADLTSTRAITVRAGIEQVWPWLAQMGQGRGGLYSYDWLENLVGCRMQSADRIVAQWQDVAPGDDFRLHPDVALTVVAVEPPHALVVRVGSPPRARSEQMTPPRRTTSPGRSCSSRSPRTALGSSSASATATRPPSPVPWSSWYRSPVSS